MANKPFVQEDRLAAIQRLACHRVWGYSTGGRLRLPNYTVHGDAMQVKLREDWMPALYVALGHFPKIICNYPSV